MLHGSCSVATQLFASFTESVQPFLIVSMLVLLSSPQIRHCEIATLLYRSLCQEAGDLLSTCRSTLQDLLLSTSPSCVHVERFVDNERATIIHRTALISIVKDRAWKCKNPNTIVQEFKHIIETAYPHSSTRGRPEIAKISTSTAAISSMRLSTMIAGALVSGGVSHLPLVLTPPRWFVLS